MDVLIIKDGRVENCICADSVERAQLFFPDHLCVERTDELSQFGPGDLHDGQSFIKAPIPAAPIENGSKTILGAS